MRFPGCMGIVLAGGESTRMGSDKALIVVDGATLLERAIHVLSHISPLCAVSSGRGKRYDGYLCIEDGDGLSGPARGIHAGLEFAIEQGMRNIFALACDIPMIMPETIARLAHYHSTAPAGTLATLYQSSEGKLEMLAGVYSVDFLPALKAGLSRGERSLYWLLPKANRQVINYSKNMAWQFSNCNKPQDIEMLRRYSVRTLCL